MYRYAFRVAVNFESIWPSTARSGRFRGPHWLRYLATVRRSDTSAIEGNFVLLPCSVAGQLHTGTHGGCMEQQPEHVSWKQSPSP